MNFVRIATDKLAEKYSEKMKLYEECFQVLCIFGIIDLIDVIRPRKNKGRTSFNNSFLLKIYMYQIMTSLSDSQLIHEINTNIVLWKFLDFDPYTQVCPDRTTVCHFRTLLRKHNIQEKIFNYVNKKIEEYGLIDKDISILDASPFQAPQSTKNKSFSRDPEMKSGPNHGSLIFGFKTNINVDSHSIVRKLIITPANTFDGNIADSLLTGEESFVYGDSAYAKTMRIKEYEKKGIKCMFQERGYRNHPLTPLQHSNNRIKSSIRAMVEHPFAKVKCVFKFRKTPFKGLDNNYKHMCMAYALTNIMVVRHDVLSISKKIE